MNSLTTAPQRDLIFISYSHQDKQWLDRLQILLKPFIREKQITVWIDPYIQVGDRWERKIDEALDRTKIAVLLISPNFLASDFIMDVELPAILNATERDDAVLFCVPISSVPKSPTLMKLSKYQWARGTEEPLGLIPDEEMRNNALVKIVDTLVTAFPLPVAPVSPAAERQVDLGRSHVPGVTERTVTDKQIGKLHGVPPQRPHFIPRTEELNRLKGALLALSTRSFGISGAASKFGLHGQGGIGKSVLAIALVNDDEVRRAFPDGIYWITVGQTPDILGLQDSLITDLSGKGTDLTGLEPCKKLLKELFEGKCCLVVLDDLWRYDDALAFDALDAGSKLLITTRDATLLTALGAHEERLDRVSKDLALELLAQWSGWDHASLPLAAQEVAEHCGRIPLALALAGARVRDGMAWEDLRDALARGHLEFLDHPYGSIFKSMRCSVDALPPDARRRYLELAIFPEDTVIPERTVHKLWHQTGGLDAIQVKSLLNTYERKGLVYTGQGQREVSLIFHDLQQDFLRLIVEDLPNLHAQFLQAYRDDLSNGTTRTPSSWSQLPAEDQYMWSYLAYHLIEAGCSDELRQVVEDVHYLAKKIYLFKAFSVERDLEMAISSTGGVAIEALGRNLAQSGHLLTGFSRSEDVLRTLYMRLRDDSALTSIADRFESSVDIPFLKPLWPMPDRPHSSLIRTLEGHTDRVKCCTFDPAGKSIVSGCLDGTFQVWDADTGTLLRTLKDDSNFRDWACDPGGRSIVCATYDGMLVLRNTVSCTAVHRIKGDRGHAESCALHPNCTTIVSGAKDGSLRLWDAASGEVLHSFEAHKTSIWCCAVDPQGKWLVSGAYDGTLRLWDVSSCTLIHTFEGHTAAVTCCAVDSQGKWIVSGSYDHTLRIWDIVQGTLTHILQGHTDSVLCCAVDPQRKWIVSGGGDCTLRLWDVATGQELRILKGHTHDVECCAADSQGKWIISGDGGGSLRLWDATVGESFRTLDSDGYEIRCFTVDPESKWIATGSDDGTIRLRDAGSGHIIRTLKGHTGTVRYCAVDPKGRWIISGSDDYTVRLWDASSGLILHILEGHTDRVRYCAIGPQGKWIVSGSDDHTLCVWELATGALVRRLEGHTEEITCCAIDPQGKWIVSGSNDRTLRLWDVVTGLPLHVLRHTDALICCTVDPWGKWVVAASGGTAKYDVTLRLWDVATGKARRDLINTEVPEKSGYAWIECCEVDPNGNWIVSGHNGTLRLWDVSVGVCLGMLETGSTRCCAIDPQGKWIVSGNYDGTLHVWHAIERESFMVIRVDDSLSSVAWFPDGRRIVTAGTKGLYVFELRGLKSA
ncbi:NB-ARC domain-containing protein [Nitrospira sp. Nam80]